MVVPLGTQSLIKPAWPAPARVRALSTTRLGGVSLPPWDSLNLGGHVGDDPDSVALNRKRLAASIGCEAEAIHWLEQVHGQRVLEIKTRLSPGPEPADAATTTQPGMICAILTADCLPVLFCDHQGSQVAAAHAGWRGLVGGVLENTLAVFDRPGAVMAWLGPAIGPGAFEVGPEVREAFLAADAGASVCFASSDANAGRFMADLYGLARRRLQAVGVNAIYGGGHCTVQERDRFFSFRRDGQTGRQASCIWLEPQP